MALKGIKVVELAGLAPAPFCGLLLAEFGASVLRIDKTDGSTAMDSLCNGKSSLALDLKSSEGKTIFLKIIKKSDILIEPFRKGVMESLGLSPNTLLKENPKLIYTRLTGFGQKGPLSSKAGHDINFISISGLLSLFGRKNEKPIFPVNFAADFAGGGLMCAFGILAALIERNNSGLGQVIDSNMVEGSAYVGSWLYRSQYLPIWGHKRGENLIDSGSHFYEVYETKDNKFMAVGALEYKFYLDLLRGLDLSEDEVPHMGNFEESKKIFEKKFKEKTQKEWCEIFKKLDACTTPVLSIDEAAVYEHNVQNQTFVKNLENNYVPQPVPKLSRTQARSLSKEPLPENGQDTENILKELNFTENEIKELQMKNVVKLFNSKL